MAFGGQNESCMEISKSYPMNGGESAFNYAQNSGYQRGVIDAARNIIAEAITQKLDIKNPTTPFHIADFGCSTGPNTFIAMRNIVEAVELKYQSMQQGSAQTLEFQIYFNDHADNDFSILFKTLPFNPPYYSAGVPGSFYKRLFPKATLHFVHSNYALQWLSKVPEEVQDEKSPAWNKGKTYCTWTKKEVREAYYSQFKNGWTSFLDARAEELVEGGLMAIQLPGIPHGAVPSQTGAGMLLEILGSCLDDMAKRGIISEEKVDSFNVPLYFPSVQDLEWMIVMNKKFTIERMELLSQPEKDSFDPILKSLHMRAVIEGIIIDNFGTKIVDELFDLFTKELDKKRDVCENELRTDVDLFVLLKHKLSGY
ncbi:hypothetical protein RJ640_006397 [Escallonia rubra]|uniref:S-adenosylmethionine-dependent methyltransferase At5g38100 n=1 Tax=Escallonia rubra TaxID=112253 RepID=A0AA88RKH6_9ASTE|nr:hypothetical protein RJ640_006397 [Escallonia rubra]